jgi:hypothetical protein
MDNVTTDYEVEDYAGKNNLTGLLSPAKLISNLVGIDANVVQGDFLHRDSLCSFYEDGGTPNILRIFNDDIYNKSLNLKDRFTLWQWFKFKDIDTAPFILDRGDKWILFSKWVSDETLAQCSYRLYLERSSLLDSIDEVKLKFDINDNGTLVTLESSALDVDALNTINMFNQWCLAAVVLNYSDQKLSLYLNNVEVAYTTLTNYGETPDNETSFIIGGQQLTNLVDDSVDVDSVFKGFIDETGISPETFNSSSLSLLWNNGNGDFYNL